MKNYYIIENNKIINKVVSDDEYAEKMGWFSEDIFNYHVDIGYIKKRVAI